MKEQLKTRITQIIGMADGPGLIAELETLGIEFTMSISE